MIERRGNSLTSALYAAYHRPLLITTKKTQRNA
jgi:hypothetical protein